MHLEIVRSLCCTYFHFALICDIIFWDGSPQSNHSFKLQKWAIRIILGVSMRSSCRQLSKMLYILPLPSVYIAETLMYVKNIYSLLIAKDVCDRQNILNKFPCVCVCLSSGDLFNFSVRVFPLLSHIF